MLRSLALLFVCVLPLHGVRGELMTPAAELAVQNATIREGAALLEAGNFREIERIGTELLATKAKQPFGAWKLRHFADAITHPRNTKDAEEWEALIGKWEAWRKESKSDFSLVMLGKIYLNYGHNARGSGFATEVTEEGWEKLGARVALAVDLLEEARRKAPANPEIYRNLLHCGIFEGWPRERMDKLVTEAIAVAPDYYDCHYNMAFYLMERWHGAEGDWQRYANSLPGRIEGDTGLMVYARLAEHLFPYYQQDFFGEDRPDRISWKRMKAGYEALVKRHPESAALLNSHACFAWRAGDLDTAREKFHALEKGGLIAESVWGGAPQVEAARKALAVAEEK